MTERIQKSDKRHYIHPDDVGEKLSRIHPKTALHFFRLGYTPKAIYDCKNDKMLTACADITQAHINEFNEAYDLIAAHTNPIISPTSDDQNSD